MTCKNAKYGGENPALNAAFLFTHLQTLLVHHNVIFGNTGQHVLSRSSTHFLSSRLAKLNQALDTNLHQTLAFHSSHTLSSKTYHPVATLIRLIGHQIRKYCDRSIILLGLDVSREFVHALDSIGLEQILVVKVVKQDVEALLGICNVLLVLCWCPRLDPL